MPTLTAGDLRQALLATAEWHAADSVPELEQVAIDSLHDLRGTARPDGAADGGLLLAARGLGDAQIAAELFVSVRTVGKHLEHVYDRLGVRTRAAAAARLLGVP